MATLKRGKIFYLVKRVPTDVAHLDTRKIVQISLKTDSGKEAAIKAVYVEEALMAYWDALRRNEGDPERYKALVLRCARRLRTQCAVFLRSGEFLIFYAYSNERISALQKAST